MPDVLIVSRTRMGSQKCVGGIVLDSGESVRLLRSDGSNQPSDSPFRIGGVWSIVYRKPSSVEPPHVEDVLIQSQTRLRQLDAAALRLELNRLRGSGSRRWWEGPISKLFDGKLRFTYKGAGYIGRDNISAGSTGFWIPDKPLTRSVKEGKVQFHYPQLLFDRVISYVGDDELECDIPAGTLLRVSLARWWAPKDSDAPQRCYLQLSGVY